MRPLSEHEEIVHEAMSWRWRLIRWWIRWNMTRDGSSAENIQTAMEYVALGWMASVLSRRVTSSASEASA